MGGQGNLTDLEYLEKIERRFQYKYPAVLKYTFSLSFFTGIIHFIKSKKFIRFPQHFLFIMPTLSAAVFREDIEVYYKFRHLKQENNQQVQQQQSQDRSNISESQLKQ